MYFAREIDYFEIDGKHILLSLLTGACDVINDCTFSCLKQENYSLLNTQTRDALIRRGYAFESEGQYIRHIEAIDQKLEAEERAQPPVFILIPSYRCNLSCTYCFEKNYVRDPLEHPDGWNSQFNFILSAVERSAFFGSGQYNPREIDITLMGGEPLLDENFEFVESAIAFAEEHGFSYSAVTNGVNLTTFIPLFERYSPGSVQVTLDGTKRIHDSRRVFIDGSGSFSRIVAGIHGLLSCGIPTYVRLNLDSGNAEDLPDFMRFIMEEFRGDPNCIPYVYPMQDGGCSYEENILDERDAIELVNRANADNPEAAIRSMFHGDDLIDFVAGSGKLRLRRRFCAATKNQYILDYSGNVYKCWYGAGKASASIGNCTTTSADKIIGGELNSRWMSRSISSISKCRQCKYRYLCGGGCLSHIYHGLESLGTPKCYDFHDLLEVQLKHLLRKRM